jgi:signal transduction histidine kinase
VFTNLLSNSIKFTNAGGIVSLNYKVFNESNLVMFDVVDTGVGLDKEKISKLCQPYQTFNDYDQNAYGNGIGLFTSE